MQQIIRGLEAVSEGTGRVISWFTLALVLLVCVKLGLRAIGVSEGEQALSELEWHLFAWIFLLGSAYALKHDAHVRVDVFYARFSERGKAWVNLLGTLVFLLPLCTVIFLESWEFAQTSYEINERSPELNGLPYRFIVKGSIALGFGLLVIQGIAIVLTNIRLLVSGKEA